MKAPKPFYEIRQNIWLEGITRNILDSGALRRLLKEGVAGGLIFNTMAMERAVKNSSAYDGAIRNMLAEKIIGEDLLIEMALTDARRAADLCRPIYDQTDGVDGWVSLDVSPRTFDDPENLANAVKALYRRARRPNIMVNVPGTKKGLIAVSKAVSEGVAVNITNLFSTEQFSSAVEAYLKGVERCMTTGLGPDSGAAVSLNIRPWHAETTENGSNGFGSPLGAAIFQRTYKCWQAFLQSPRWKRAWRERARPPRLLCTGIEIDIPETLKALTGKELAVPFTVFTMLEKRSNPSVRGKWNYKPIPADDKDSDKVISRFVRAGADMDTLAEGFQKDAVSLFVKDWFDLMTAIARKSAAIIQVG